MGKQEVILKTEQIVIFIKILRLNEIVSHHKL